MKNSDQPAYPIEADNVSTNSKGLTKREYIATEVLKAIAGKPGSLSKSEIDTLVTHTVRLTDELLKQLES